MSCKDHDLIIAEIHHAINKLGGSAQPAAPDEAQRVLRDLGVDIDLRSIVDSWQDTLPDEQILAFLRNWNAGLEWRVDRRSSHYVNGKLVYTSYDNKVSESHSKDPNMYATHIHVQLGGSVYRAYFGETN